MTSLRQRTRVGPDGNVTVAVGLDVAGTEVDVVVTPTRPPLTREEYVALIDQTAGSINDPTFVRPPQWDIRPRESLD